MWYSSGRVDDGQTNSVLFHLSVWPSNADLSRSAASSEQTHSSYHYQSTHYPTIITVSAFGIPSKSVLRFIFIVPGDINIITMSSKHQKGPDLKRFMVRDGGESSCCSFRHVDSDLTNNKIIAN